MSLKQIIDEISRMDHGRLEMFVAGGVGICAFVALTTMFACWQWRKWKQVELEIAFKDELLSRGLPADDVVRIIRATRPGLFSRLAAGGDWLFGKAAYAAGGVVSVIGGVLTGMATFLVQFMGAVTSGFRPSMGQAAAAFAGDVGPGVGKGWTNARWQGVPHLMQRSVAAAARGMSAAAAQMQRVAEKMQRRA